MTGEYPEVPLVAVGAIVVRDDQVLLVRRGQPPSEGLWAIPGGRMELGETLQEAAEREIKEETGLTVGIQEHLTQIKHAYTHFKIVMDIFICHIESGNIRLNGPVDHRWITPEDINTYAFPKANLKFVPELMKYLSKSI